MVTAGVESLVVILNLEEPDAHPAYDLEILRFVRYGGAGGAGGDSGDGDERAQASVWRARSLRPTAFGNLTLVLPASSLPAGDYRLVLVASGASSGSPVAAYTLRLIAGS